MQLRDVAWMPMMSGIEMATVKSSGIVAGMLLLLTLLTGVGHMQ
jgi:hypothetical protein